MENERRSTPMTFVSSVVAIPLFSKRSMNLNVHSNPLNPLIVATKHHRDTMIIMLTLLSLNHHLIWMILTDRLLDIYSVVIYLNKQISRFILINLKRRRSNQTFRSIRSFRPWLFNKLRNHRSSISYTLECVLIAHLPCIRFWQEIRRSFERICLQAIDCILSVLLKSIDVLGICVEEESLIAIVIIQVSNRSS